MARKFDRKVVLENGTEYCGFGFGEKKDGVCEIVFNTSMFGYQEIISDLSYANQMVVMTYPLIGNYGIADDDFESKVPAIGGLIVREYNDLPSNFRYTKTLSEILEENHIPAISGVDTRKLTKFIRDNGSCKAIITDIDTPTEKALEIINNTTLPSNIVEIVGCKKKWYSRTSNHKFNVIAIDCGIKLNIIRTLNQYSCNVTVVPYNTTAEEILALHPDGVVVSNGPGNPEDVDKVVDAINGIKGKLPIFGIGLGFQLLCLAYGAKTYKLKCGHHGGSAVRNLRTNKLEMTSQNHSYGVVAESLANTCLEVTHTNVSDNSVEGVACSKDMVFGVQYQPESAPGPQDSLYLFDEFVSMMKGSKENA